jgi:hypothetical protein
MPPSSLLVDLTDLVQVAKHLGTFHGKNNSQNWFDPEQVAGSIPKVFMDLVPYDGSFEAFSAP